MVFPGRLSTGCKLCRRRKVKCDEGKPGCNRCAIYGRPCPGYGDNFQFRPQEAKIRKAVAAAHASGQKASFAARVKPRQGSGSSHSDSGRSGASTTSQLSAFDEIIFKQESPSSETVVVTTSQGLGPNLEQWQPEHQFSITPSQHRPQDQLQHQRQHQHQPGPRHRHKQHRPQPPNLELNFATSYQQWLAAPLPTPSPVPSREHQSLCYFMNRFVARGMSDPFPGHLSFLYSLYDSKCMSSLELATLSAAEMAAYNKFGVPGMKQRAYRNRGAAIRALSTALSSPDRNVRFNDKTVATVLLLATFSDISGEGGARDGGHVPGLYYLLEQRGKEALMTKMGSEIFFLGVMKLHIHSFVTNDYSYADPGGYSEFMQNVDPLWRGRALVCKIPRLRCTLSDHLNAMAKRYKLEASSESNDDSGGPPPPPIQEDDVYQIMELYVSCMEVLHEFRLWDQTIANSPAFNPEIVELKTSCTPISPLSMHAPALDTSAAPAVENQPTPKRYDSSTACTVILLKSSRLMLLLSLLAYFKRLRDWVAAHPRLLGNPAENPLLAAFSDPEASKADAEKLLDDVRESVNEIERCVPFALGHEDDDLDGIASFQEGGAGRGAGLRLATNQIEVAAAGLIIMNSLILVYMCPYSTPQQRKMSTDVLRRLDKNMSIRAARCRLKELSEAGPVGLFY